MSSWQPYPVWTGQPIPQFNTFNQPPGVPAPGVPWYPMPGGAIPTSGNPPQPPKKSKYENLNPILAKDSTDLRVNLTRSPKASISQFHYHRHQMEPVILTKSNHIRIISREFPWQIDITAARPAPITCEDLWNALHAALQVPIVDSEWGFILRENDGAARTTGAMKERLAANPLSEKIPLRIDYLGSTVVFRGLEKDDDFVKSRLLPQGAGCADTWVAKLISD